MKKSTVLLFGIGLVLLSGEVAFCNEKEEGVVMFNKKKMYEVDDGGQTLQKMPNEMSPELYRNMSNTELRRLLSDLSATQNTVADLLVVRSKAEEEASRRLEDLQEMEERSERAENELKQARERLEQAENELKQTRERLEHAENELKQFNEQMDGNEAEKRQLQRDNETLQKQVSELKAEEAKLKEEIEKLRKEIEELQAKISDLEKEIESLKKKLEDKDKEIKRLTDEKAKTEKKIEELEKNDDELKKLKRRQRGWVNQISANGAAYRQAVGTLREDIETLDGTLKEFDRTDSKGWREYVKSAKSSMSIFENIMDNFNGLREEISKKISNKDETEQRENTGNGGVN